MQRRQATVVFNDISGYTSLMQDDETFAVQLRQRHKEVVDRLTQQYNGKIIQYYGDGTLTLFDCSRDAVECALSMQKEFDQSPQIPLRIGINSGDVLLGPDGIYGDCVNIASRIERMSVPGSILISENVHQEVARYDEIKTKDLGHFELKNVKNPMHIHAIVSDGVKVPDQKELIGKIGFKEKAIIVLPFYNLSKDPESEFFSDGITEQIIYALSDIEGLRVTSRTSSFAFKDKPVNLRELHQDFGIDHVLEGSVRQYGNKVRITAQLINASDDFHLWSETYNREVEDVFQVQDEIALMISNKLKAGFQASLRKHDFKDNDESVPDSKPEAKDYYARGRYYWSQMQPGYVDRSIRNFKQAIETDEQFHLGWTALAKSYVYKGMYNLMLPEEAGSHVHNCLEKACKLNKNHSHTRSTRALYHLFYTWHFNEVSKCLAPNENEETESFMLINPMNHVRGLHAMVFNKYDEAIEYLRQSLKLDPLNLAIQIDLARALMNAGELLKALDHINHIIDTRPDFLQAMELKGWILYNLGKKRDSINMFKSFRKLSPSPIAGLAGLSYVYARTMQTKLAVEVKELMASVTRDMPSYVPHYGLALAHLGAQEYEAMFEQLKLAVNRKMPVMVFLDSNPIWDEIKRFNAYRNLTEQIYAQA